MDQWEYMLPPLIPSAPSATIEGLLLHASISLQHNETEREMAPQTTYKAMTVDNTASATIINRIQLSSFLGQ